MEAKSAVFLPLFLGTLPNARSPFGARALKRVMEVWVPHSSTHTNLFGSTLPARLRKAHLSRSSRSEEPRVFF